MMNAAATATAAASTTGLPRQERRKRLSPAALAVVNQKVRDAYSRVVVVGAVRIAVFVPLSAVGTAIYLAYVMPIDGFVWSYVWAVLGVATEGGATPWTLLSNTLNEEAAVIPTNTATDAIWGDYAYTRVDNAAHSWDCEGYSYFLVGVQRASPGDAPPAELEAKIV